MKLSAVFLALGSERFDALIRHISIGKLKTYQLYERMRARTHLSKLNAANLKKAAPRLWERLEGEDEDLARDLAQAILLGHFDMIIAVLDFLGVSHENGFFNKDIDLAQSLGEGWQARALEQFRGQHPEEVLVLYLNHLAWESKAAGEPFLPAPASS